MKYNWIEKYWEFMISEDFEKAIPLKDLNFPKSFFKYSALSEKTIESIEQNYVWVAEISSLNDPFECSIQFDNDECLRLYYSSDVFKETFSRITRYSLTTNEIEKLVSSQKPFETYIEICRNRNIPFSQTPEQQLSKVQDRWKEIVEETNNNLRICSFSLINSSLLLWSHYSKGHKGICLEYDFENVDIIRPFMQPVIYRDKVHKIGIFEEYTTMQMIGSSLIKSSEWGHEQEWRLTIFRQEDNFTHKITSPNPQAIYLGTRFDSNEVKLKNRLLKLATEKNIPIYQMEKHPNEFKLIKNTFANNK